MIYDPEGPSAKLPDRLYYTGWAVLLLGVVLGILGVH